MDSDRAWRRRDTKTLKQQLPYPYNQDLSKILRALTDPSTRALDRDGRPSLLELGALALIVGCLESDGHDDSRTLEQAVRALIGDPPTGAERG